MKDTKIKMIVNVLCIIWALSFLAVSIITNGYLSSLSGERYSSALQRFSSYHLMLLAVVLLFFCPMVFLIQHLSKQVGRKKTMIAFRILFAHHIIWAITTVFFENVGS